MKRFWAVTCSAVLAACGGDVFDPDAATEAEIARRLTASKCDEDNVSKAPDTDPGVIAASVPGPMIAFIRAQGWNCMHRGWHAQRRFNFILGPVEKKYVVDRGWFTIDAATGLLNDPKVAQAGAPGNGLEFLAMHRVMYSMLREAFPNEKMTSLGGWAAVPTTSTTTEPLPPNARPFDSFFTSAVSRLSNSADLARFPSDDEFGAYIQTKNYPGRGRDYTFLNPDRSAGVHDYLHNRYNIVDATNPAAAVRMSNFARNIENRVFWKLHGWLDGRWTAYRQAKALRDSTDKVYLDAMNFACGHMGRGMWKVTADGDGVCTAGSGSHHHP